MSATMYNPPDEGCESIIQPGNIHSLSPEVLPGRLAMVKMIAGAGHTDVYKGYWTTEGGNDVSVAIKRLKRVRLGVVEDEHEAIQERFERRIKREVIIWQTAVHENILPFIGYQIVDGDAMLVSPWCENGNLGRFIRNQPNLSYVTKLELLNGAARGLAYLHSLRPPIIHGDITPDNIMVTDDIRAVLCDFGISRLMTSLDLNTGFTTGPPNHQTTAYLAKELLEGDSPWPTTGSDVYAFGCVILMTMSGKAPFYQLARLSSVATALAVISGRIASPSDHPGLPESDPLWDLLRRCWLDPPSERPPATEVVYMLEAARLQALP